MTNPDFPVPAGLVTELDTDQAKPAWLSHDSRRRMDLMTVKVAGGPKTLKAIHIQAEFEGDLQGKSIDTPSIIISGITAE